MVEGVRSGREVLYLRPKRHSFLANPERVCDGAYIPSHEDLPLSVAKLWWSGNHVKSARGGTNA
jgi:hypothetical protein